MIYICAQPAELYFAWQVEVMLNNFIAMGVDLKDVDIVCSCDEVPIEWVKMQQAYQANFYFYKDTRVRKHYTSSIRPNILKQHFAKYPDLKKETIFYHDCDIVFARPPSEWIEEFMITDDKCYGSDTNGYISASYIESKGHNLFLKMCGIVNINPNLVRSNDKNCIGAQYLLKGIDRKFWEEVEINSESLFFEIKPESVKAREKEREQFIKTNKDPNKKFDKEVYNELQIWCADMWAVLWQLWKDNKETVVHPNFSFSWAPYEANNYDLHNIMHNAGICDPGQRPEHKSFFYKQEYRNSLPYDHCRPIKFDSVSRKYFEWVKLTGLRTCLR